MNTQFKLFLAVILLYYVALSAETYPIVDTGIHQFYNNTVIIDTPAEGTDFYGQDACYQGHEPSYTDNGDGTISDNVTGLMWQQNMGNKVSFYEAFSKADTLSLGGYTDWRMPTIKELYSLIQFTGQSSGENSITMYIDTLYFNQPLGNPRPIDAQTWSSTRYLSLTMQADSTVFGVNFVDGRIKGYPLYLPGTNNSQFHMLYARMVRGNSNYGVNDFIDNADGTISDHSTGLMWQQSDDGVPRDWQNALSYAENLNFAGYADWRLPNAKELHSIVDYTRCPSITNSAAINPIFQTTMIIDPNGNPGQYPYFWTSTSHLDGPNPYTRGVYIAFGEAQGLMNNTLMDVHGAGAQRSDPKTGNPTDYPQYQGPQGDVLYTFNHVRCVRDIGGSVGIEENQNHQTVVSSVSAYPNPCHMANMISFQIKPLPSQSGNLEIYNLRGQIVKSYSVDANTQQLYWDQKDKNGRQCPSGVYLYKLNTRNAEEIGRITLLK